jgi:hypothetical protein
MTRRLNRWRNASLRLKQMIVLIYIFTGGARRCSTL